jgi:hypothetical protein
MKTIVLCVLFFLCLYTTSAAQHTRQNKTKQVKAVTKKAATKNTHPKDTVSNKLVSVNNSSAYAAPATQYKISDPVLLRMNQQANGSVYQTNLKTGLDVMPKGTYGLVKGRIILMPSDARTSGGITGSGGIGTGTSIGIAGSNGPAMQVNGKNLYAAPGIYGDRTIGVYRNNIILDFLPILNNQKP